MERIDVNIPAVNEANSQMPSLQRQCTNTRQSFSDTRSSMDGRILERNSIGARCNNVNNDIQMIEDQIRGMCLFVENVILLYSDNEARLSQCRVETESIRGNSERGFWQSLLYHSDIQRNWGHMSDMLDSEVDTYFGADVRSIISLSPVGPLNLMRELGVNASRRRNRGYSNEQIVAEGMRDIVNGGISKVSWLNSRLHLFSMSLQNLGENWRNPHEFLVQGARDLETANTKYRDFNSRFQSQRAVGAAPASLKAINAIENTNVVRGSSVNNYPMILWCMFE